MIKINERKKKWFACLALSQHWSRHFFYQLLLLLFLLLSLLLLLLLLFALIFNIMLFFFNSIFCGKYQYEQTSPEKLWFSFFIILKLAQGILFALSLKNSLRHGHLISEGPYLANQELSTAFGRVARKMVRNRVFDCHLSFDWRQMAIENTVSCYFVIHVRRLLRTFSIATYPVWFTAEHIEWSLSRSQLLRQVFSWRGTLGILILVKAYEVEVWGPSTDNLLR